MSFSKLLVLKSVDDKNFSSNKIIGVLKIVKENKITVFIDFYITLKNDCYAFFCDDENDYSIPLSNDLKQSFVLDGDLCVDNFNFCIFKKSDFNIITATFNGNNKIDVLDLKKLVKHSFDYKKEDYAYDDEQIATKNYYATNGVYYQNENADDNNMQTQEKEENGDLPILNETIFIKNKDYFFKVQDKVNDLLLNNTENTFLKAVYKNSVFVDIRYNKSDYYSFGIIYDDSTFKRAKYICYAVLGAYNNTPKGFENISRFTPLKSFLPYGDGYYIIFQNAHDGKTLT